MPLLDFQVSAVGDSPTIPWVFAGDRTKLVSRGARLGKCLAALQTLPVWIALCAGTLVGTACAEPGDTNTLTQITRPSPVLLQATVQNGEIVGFEQKRRIFINVGSRRLVFLLPLGFHASVSDPEKIVLFNNNLTCAFTLRILETAASSGTNGLSAELCRSWVTARFDEAIIKEDLTVSAGGETGPAFDLMCKQDRVTRNVRIGFVATSVGVLEFELATSPEQFDAAKTMMRALLRGLQISDAHGMLTIQVSRGDN